MLCDYLMGMNLPRGLSRSAVNVNIPRRSQLSGLKHRTHTHPAVSLGVTVMPCGAVSAGRYLAQVSSHAPATPGTWYEAQLPFDLSSEGWRGEGGGRRTPGSWAVSAVVPAPSCCPVEAQCPPSER